MCVSAVGLAHLVESVPAATSQGAVGLGVRQQISNLQDNPFLPVCVPSEGFVDAGGRKLTSGLTNREFSPYCPPSAANKGRLYFLGPRLFMFVLFFTECPQAEAHTSAHILTQQSLSQQICMFFIVQ